MRLTPILLTSALALGFSANTALAYVDIETVRAMAFDRGIVKIEEVELKRRKGIWEVEGEDAYGQEIEMEVDAVTGRVLKMKRD